MKYKIFLLITLLAVTTLESCSDWLDINKDPNNLSELQSPESVIPAAQVNLANNLMGWDMGFAGAFWSQYWTQNHTASQFKVLDEYQEVEFDYAQLNLYAGVLNDLKAISIQSDSTSGNYLLAEALSIYTWQVITDVWGDMPYTEALQGDEGIGSPAFDSGEDIYADLLTRIDALLSSDFSSATINSDYDFVFEGDIDSWIQFANSVKLKLMIRLSETAAYDNDEVLAFVQSGNFLTTNAMIPGTIWSETGQDGKLHPMVEFQANGANTLSTNVIASKTFLDYLLVNSDPRLDTYFVPTSSGQVGSFQGDFASQFDSNQNGTPDDEEEFSTVEFAVDADIPLISVWDVEFYIAEVYARAGDNANAKIHYDNAVNASLQYWGVTTTITGAGEYAEWQNGTIEEGIKQIAMQKWVAECKLEHIEAFIERNRTKYPSVNEIDIARDRVNAYQNFPIGEFTISVEGRGKLNENLPSSPIYPNDVLSRNTNAPGQKPNLGVKVWWDQKAGK